MEGIGYLERGIWVKNYMIHFTQSNFAAGNRILGGKKTVKQSQQGIGGSEYSSNVWNQHPQTGKPRFPKGDGSGLRRIYLRDPKAKPFTYHIPNTFRTKYLEDRDPGRM